ncbi:hypothetical protein Barb6XT_02024 [Bacteroidales bacterium Barb6XT]|nr:hypothetical protein Barb6XT_02024 [Bacteroidales bacterium Barb6XT]
MLQRIQTLYLLLIAALMTAVFFLPLAVVSSGEQVYTFDVAGLHTATAAPELVYPTWGLFALTAIIALTAFATVFLFKTRVKQLRLCIFNAVLMVGFYGFFLFFVFHVVKGQHPDAMTRVKIALSFPLVGLILNYLAIRNIGADEALVRSLERLR